ncbi:MAG: PDZ domain-containing protein [Cryomorphaceae bacterium]|nr:PDZ domain-containing protein [Cryomorphaceae bacterium]
MKRILGMFLVAALGGTFAVAAFTMIDRETPLVVDQVMNTAPIRTVNFAPAGNMDFTIAAEKTVNAVVHVKTESTFDPVVNNPWLDLFGYQAGPQVQHGSGSGVIIDESGYIVTNNHVIDGAQKITVSLNNNKTYEATLVGTDLSTDIAVLKIEANALPTVSFGNSDDIRIGEWVLAVGNPFDLTSTVTAGIVSAKARNINLLRGNSNREIFPIESFIQTDAAVNPGNSGGALVNTNGQLVGINTAIASQTGSYSGYSFAVPSAIVEKVVRDIREFGMVQRAFIGVQISDVTQDIAEETGMNQISGVYISGIVESGAASEAGIEEGDVIVKVADHEVRSVPELQEQVSRYRPGDKLQLTLWRDRAYKQVELTLTNKDGNTALTDKETVIASASLGAVLKDIGEKERTTLRLPGGVKVEKLDNGKLKDSGVKEGFIIAKVDGQRVYSKAEFEQALIGKSGGVLIEGVYPNGSKAYYGLGL